MKTIIAGSRTISDLAIVEKAVFDSGFKITEVVSGGARGVDNLGEKYAANNNLPLKLFRADWKRLGKSAGYVRNREMAGYAAALVAVWDGESKGTKNMIEEARKYSLKVFVLNVKEAS